MPADPAVTDPWLAATPHPKGGLLLHATTVAYGGRALLIRGASGTGKSALALSLIALGATLVSDDGTWLRSGPNGPIAQPPTDAVAGLIEARHMGILRVPPGGAHPLAAVVDLDRNETERLPPPCHVRVMGHRVPLYWRVAAAHFVPALLLILAHPQSDP